MSNLIIFEQGSQPVKLMRQFSICKMLICMDLLVSSQTEDGAAAAHFKKPTRPPHAL